MLPGIKLFDLSGRVAIVTGGAGSVGKASAKLFVAEGANVMLVDLDEAALIIILTEPKNALIKQYQRLFEMEDTQLTFTDDALMAIAKRAIERKTGARGLRSILEEVLLDTMFELPSMEGVEEVVVNDECIMRKGEPLLIYADRKEGSASAS